MPKKNDSARENVTYLPHARTADLVMQDVGSDVLVFDTRTRKAHHLNQSTTDIWRKCDGQTTIAEIAAFLTDQKGEDIKSDFVILALIELDKADLLVTKLPKIEFGQFSRRKVLLRYAAPALAFPVVMSLVAPASAQVAGSCLGPFEQDCRVTPCCPGLSCFDPVGIVTPGTCVPTPS